MNRAERAQIISDILDNQYKKIPVPLDHSDPFTLLIAVLLSAQCTDAVSYTHLTLPTTYHV